MFYLLICLWCKVVATETKMILPQNFQGGVYVVVLRLQFSSHGWDHGKQVFRFSSGLQQIHLQPCIKNKRLFCLDSRERKSYLAFWYLSPWFESSNLSKFILFVSSSWTNCSILLSFLSTFLSKASTTLEVLASLFSTSFWPNVILEFLSWSCLLKWILIFKLTRVDCSF